MRGFADLGQPRPVRTPGWKQAVGRTGIDKRPVAHRVRFANDQVQGDAVCDVEHHGGHDQAVYAYATEDAAWWPANSTAWSSLVNSARTSPPKASTRPARSSGNDGQSEARSCRSSSPRIPCRTLAGFWEVPDMIRRFTQAGRPGAYLRIVTEGDIGAGDRIEVVHRPEPWSHTG